MEGYWKHIGTRALPLRSLEPRHWRFLSIAVKDGSNIAYTYNRRDLIGIAADLQATGLGTLWFPSNGQLYGPKFKALMPDAAEALPYGEWNYA